MAKSKRTEKVSITVRAEGVRKRAGSMLAQVSGRRREPANPAQRALDDIKKLVSEATGRPPSRQAAAKQTAAERQRKARRRQATAKKAASARRKSG